MAYMVKSLAVAQEVLKQLVPVGFSLGSCNNGRSSTPMIAENNDMNVINNRLINISVNPYVHDSCELVPEVKSDKVRTEVLDNVDNVKKVSNDFNLEVRGSLRPNGHKDPELREWEKNVLIQLNNVNLVERDDCKTSYVKFKLFKQDIIRVSLSRYRQFSERYFSVK